MNYYLHDLDLREQVTLRFYHTRSSGCDLTNMHIYRQLIQEY